MLRVIAKRVDVKVPGRVGGQIGGTRLKGRGYIELRVLHDKTQSMTVFGTCFRQLRRLI
ncbi:hypothetical protein DGo_PE0003 (plasmid) [Deinococcus gobiensis I-0]|uniref:Uncharacterized protein n=1 Tax=Deinococcus gobiensis (strain DSM 21396 / JCM 16679 / CGMCC 1.7299 / I-0) TaxID=745776 RepID=H8H3Q0_DEIGI|nr:hypothetical protein DGo_PE0003 [Deinococcus gobiensis I-0]